MSLLKKMQSGGAIGIFSKTTDSAIIEAAGISGLDFVILDTEHGPSSLETLHHHIRAAKLTQMDPIVRVKHIDSNAIGSALDAGASGVQIPNINTAEQAEEAVKAARFHPHGSRGVCRFVRAAQYGDRERSSYFTEANKATLILQVEGLEGVRNLNAIMAVEGFDVLFVGPYDLSQSVGKPGQIDAPEVTSLISSIAERATQRNILLGAFCDTPQAAKMLKSQGFQYVSYSVDINIFLEACKALKGIADE